MEVLAPPKREKRKQKPDKNDRKPKPNGLWILLLIGGLITAMVASSDFVRKTPDGNYELSPEREAELNRRKEQYDNAEQYALVAAQSGWYQCFNCGDETKIYLYIGEVWKYGVSKNGSRRYTNIWYRTNKLQYVTEFQGTWTDCFKRELDQIYNYPLLPQNLKREKLIYRPPGNPKDY